MSSGSIAVGLNLVQPPIVGWQLVVEDMELASEAMDAALNAPDPVHAVPLGLTARLQLRTRQDRFAKAVS